MARLFNPPLPPPLPPQSVSPVRSVSLGDRGYANGDGAPLARYPFSAFFSAEANQRRERRVISGYIISFVRAYAERRGRAHARVCTRVRRLFSRLLRFIRRASVTRDPAALIRSLIARDYSDDYPGIHYRSPNRDQAASRFRSRARA